MSDLQMLTDRAMSLNGQRIEEYKRMKDFYNLGDFTLEVDFVPEDPDRYPVRMRVRMPIEKSGFPPYLFDSSIRETALRDFISRAFAEEARKSICRIPRGRDGKVSIDRPGREVLETSAVVAGNGFIEARFNVDLPAIKGRIPDPQAVQMFTRYIPRIVRSSMMYDTCDKEAFAAWTETVEDAEALRASLLDRGYVAFIADGSVLVGRKYLTGDDDTPVFRVPEGYLETIDLPNKGKIRGMGIPKGVTVITGDFFQGKSTFVKTLAHGVYNHVPGDGREFVVTVPDAVMVRSEEGRSVAGVDVSVLLGAVKSGINVKQFSTDSADELESFAVNFAETLEIGTSLVLLDEDTIPPGLSSRDEVFERLVGGETATVTPLVDCVAALRDERGISTVVAATSAEWLDIADTVFVMKNRRIEDATDHAREILRKIPVHRAKGRAVTLPGDVKRIPVAQSLDPLKAEFPERLYTNARETVHYGDERIDCSRVTQLVSPSQARGISRGISLIRRVIEGSGSLREAVERVMERVDKVGLDTLSNRCMGDLAGFRKQELIAAVNRLKGIRIT